MWTNVDTLDGRHLPGHGVGPAAHVAADSQTPPSRQQGISLAGQRGCAICTGARWGVRRGADGADGVSVYIPIHHDFSLFFLGFSGFFWGFGFRVSGFGADGADGVSVYIPIRHEFSFIFIVSDPLSNVSFHSFLLYSFRLKYVPPPTVVYVLPTRLIPTEHNRTTHILVPIPRLHTLHVVPITNTITSIHPTSPSLSQR